MGKRRRKQRRRKQKAQGDEQLREQLKRTKQRLAVMRGVGFTLLGELTEVHDRIRNDAPEYAERLDAVLKKAGLELQR